MIQKQTHTWLGAVAILVVVSTLAILHGVRGLLTAIGIALSWYALPSVYAFTIGQFALIALASKSGPIPIQTGLLEAGLIGILVEPAMYDDRRLRLVVLSGLGISLSVSLVWGLSALVHPLWKTVVSLTASLALMTYSIHRYERFKLGLVKEVS